MTFGYGLLWYLLFLLLSLFPELLCCATSMLHIMNSIHIVVELLSKRCSFLVVDHVFVDLVFDHDEANQVIVDD